MKNLRGFFWMTAGPALAFTFKSALAADTLQPVSPPTDWFGVGLLVVVAIVMLLIFALVAYVIHIRKTPGQQFGEEQLERLADLIARKQEVVHTVSVAEPLTYDGTTFADQAALDEYKAAKAIIDKHKGGNT